MASSIDLFEIFKLCLLLISYLFRKAGEFLDDEKLDLEVPMDRYQLPKELQDLLENRLNAYNNLAMAQMKIEAWDSALAALQQVLKIEVLNWCLMKLSKLIMINTRNSL